MNDQIEHLRQTAVTDLRSALRLAGIGETRGYELARRGALPFPVLRVGSIYKVPTASLLAALGLNEAADTTDWKTKYEEAIAHSRKWEKRARANMRIVHDLMEDDPAKSGAA